MAAAMIGHQMQAVAAGILGELYPPLSGTGPQELGTEVCNIFDIYFATQVQHPELLSPNRRIDSYRIKWFSDVCFSGIQLNMPFPETRPSARDGNMAKNLNSLGIKVSRSQNASKNIVLHRLNVAKHYFAGPMTHDPVVSALLLEASLTGGSSFRIFKGVATSENLREFNGGMAKNIVCQTPDDLPDDFILNLWRCKTQNATHWTQSEHKRPIGRS